MRQIVLYKWDRLSNHAAMDQKLTWQIVNEAATALGVGEAARLKWRQEGRGVPPVWRIRIAEHLKVDGRTIDMADFDALPETPGRIAA